MSKRADMQNIDSDAQDFLLAEQFHKSVQSAFLCMHQSLQEKVVEHKCKAPGASALLFKLSCRAMAT
eukprot:175493-Pelagomonas_calceolata.AAC.2